MRKALSVVVVLPLLTACSGASDPAPAVAASDEASLSKHATHLAATWPRARCTPHELVGDGEPMQLIADDYGDVRVDVTTSEPTSDGVALDCVSESGERGSVVTARETSLRRSVKRVLAPGHYMRPALAPEERNTLSAAELRSRGYPARPHASRGAAADAQWVAMVSAPFEFVPPGKSVEGRATQSPAQRATRGGRSQAAKSRASLLPLEVTPWTDPTWGGEVLVNFDERYSKAGGTIDVPVITVSQSAPSEMAGGEWIGLGGFWADNDLLQAGLGFETHRATGSHTTYSYLYAFREYLKAQEKPGHTTLPVSARPHDRLAVTVWRGDENGVEDPNGAFGWTDVENLDTFEFSTDRVDLVLTAPEPPAELGYTGEMAEWIIERPEGQNDGMELPNFGATGITGCYAHTSNGNWENFANSEHLYDVTLVNRSGQALAAQWIWDDTSVNFQWLRSR